MTIRERETVEKVVNAIGYLEEGRGGKDGVGSDTIAAWRQSGDQREISWSDQGGVAIELDELSRANQDGSEFQQGEPLAASDGLQVEECDFGPFFSAT